ncbi:TPA: hypothetical protein SMW50_005794 [Pseudomonas aeruginosa]|nr:hypothetical protein [Pseudomonas aeruginosa]EIU2864561.1 hypothetical protein [Pseudomonas aeruginosa]HEK3716897.1 hypothetical protein [Pseudomonas aeruginosa]
MSTEISNLRSLGMTGSACPVTNVLAPNVSRSFGQFSISYLRYCPVYGSNTTAIVLAGRVFLVLNGNHAEQLIDAASTCGIQGCVDYFAENIAHANSYSEHLMATGVVSDLFGLYGTALEVMSQLGIDKIAKAAA